MAAATSLNLWGILCESQRIINAHSRHFLALSVIFLLPLSFSLIVSLFLLIPDKSSHIHILLRFTQSLLPEPPSFPFSLPLFLFSLFLLLFFLFSLSSITHSVFHGFFGRPVKLLSSLLSIPSSFLPLLTTTILLFSLSLPLPLLLLHLRPLPLSSPIFLSVCFLLLLALLYLRITWTLAPVIAILDSTVGLAPLLRSAYLTTNMKPLAASVFLFFASSQALLLWTTSALVSGSHGWAFVVQIVLTSALFMLLMLYNAAADTVLYMYCKAVHGELELEIAEEFAWQYFCLPFDDAKVPHVVSVAHL